MRTLRSVVPVQSWFDAACKRMQEEESERRVVVVIGLYAALCSVKDDGSRAPVFLLVGSMFSVGVSRC